MSDDSDQTISADHDYNGDIDEDEIPDTGGVPQTLTLSRYRSVSPMIGFSASAVVIGVIASVLWTVVGHPHPSLAGTPPLKVVATTDPTQVKTVVPDPTDPPIQGTPRKHPVITVENHHALRVTSSANTTVSSSEFGPSGQTEAQLASEEDARRLAAATYASSRMQLNTQNDQSPENVAYASGANTQSDPQIHEASDRSVIASTSDGSSQNTNPHGNFTASRSGNPGYESATSPYELVSGTIIPARLITAIDSTVPGGLMKAQVTESVYDSRTHSVVVIPQGTIVIGYYDQALYGDARLVAAWTELYFPNGRKFFASANEGTGAKGEAGMPVSVDTHAGRAFGNAFVGAVLQAGMNLASRATTIDISTAGNSAQPQRQSPTLHAYPGQPFNIVLNHDLPLEPYVETEP